MTTNSLAAKELMRGDLFKKGFVEQNFKKRYFQLTSDGKLAGWGSDPYKSSSYKPAKDSISVLGARVERDTEHSAASRYRFSVTPITSGGNQRKYIFEVATEEDDGRWLTVLTQAANPPLSMSLNSPLPVRPAFPVSGYMFKQGYMNNAFKKRYFQLTSDGKLSWCVGDTFRTPYAHAACSSSSSSSCSS